jgi:hypothetical protein
MAFEKGINTASTGNIFRETRPFFDVKKVIKNDGGNREICKQGA